MSICTDEHRFNGRKRRKPRDRIMAGRRGGQGRNRLRGRGRERERGRTADGQTKPQRRDGTQRKGARKMVIASERFGPLQDRLGWPWVMRIRGLSICVT